MKKVTCIIFSFIMLFAHYISTYANSPVTIFINNTQIATDQPATIINNRVMVPARAISEALNCEVTWNEATQDVYISTKFKAETTINFRINRQKMIIKNNWQNTVVTLDSAPVIINGRTLVPLRAIAEALCTIVEWHADTRRVDITELYDEVNYVERNLFLVKKDGKTGIADINKNILLPIEYDSIEPIQYDNMGLFTNGYAKVKNDSKYGLIDSNLNIILPPAYDYIKPYDNGYIVISRDKKYGISDSKGNIILPLEHYEVKVVTQVNQFIIQTNGHKFGTADNNGNIIIPPEYDALYYDTCYYNAKKNSHYGILDTNGNTVIPFEHYSQIKVHSPECIEINKDGKNGFINHKNELTIPAIYDFVDPPAVHDSYTNVRKDGLQGLINIATGKLIIPAEYHKVMYLSNGLIYVERNGKKGYLNEDGNEIIPIIYDSISSTKYNHFIVEINGKYGILDESGKNVADTIYDNIEQFNGNDGYYRISSDGKFGIIDIKGNVVVTMIYRSVYFQGSEYFQVAEGESQKIIDRNGNTLFCIDEYDTVVNMHNDYFKVSKNGLYGVLDKSGNVVIPLLFDFCYWLADGLACVKKDGKKGLADSTGSFIVPNIYDNIYTFSEGIAVVTNGINFGAIDRKGNIILPLIYEYVGPRSEGYSIIQKDIQRGYADSSGAIVIPAIFDNAEDFKDGRAKVSKGNETYYIDKNGNRIE